MENQTLTAADSKRVGYLPLALETLAVCLAKPGETPEKFGDIDKSPTAIQLQEFQKAAGMLFLVLKESLPP